MINKPAAQAAANAEGLLALIAELVAELHPEVAARTIASPSATSIGRMALSFGGNGRTYAPCPVRNSKRVVGNVGQ